MYVVLSPQVPPDDWECCLLNSPSTACRWRGWLFWICSFLGAKPPNFLAQKAIPASALLITWLQFYQVQPTFPQVCFPPASHFLITNPPLAPKESAPWEFTQAITSGSHISLSNMHNVLHCAKLQHLIPPRLVYFPSKPVLKLCYQKCRGNSRKWTSIHGCSTSFIRIIYCTQSVSLQSNCYYLCFKNMLAREIKGTGRLA